MAQEDALNPQPEASDDELGARRRADSERDNERSQICNDLDAIYDGLVHAATRLAFAGEWRVWAETQPIGTIVNIDLNRLAAVQDLEVRSLLDLAERVIATQQALRRR